MSTSVTGSAATTTHFVGVGASATARSTCSRKISALAKNSGASHRKSTRPGMRLASGWRVMSW